MEPSQSYDEVAFVPFPSDVLTQMPGLADHTRILVNGVALEDLVLDESHSNPGGWLWTGPPKDLLRLAPEHLLGQADHWTDRLYLDPSDDPGDTVFEAGEVPLLADAGCADTFCSSLGARVISNEDSVVWTDFAVSQGGYKEDSALVRRTSFRFSLDAYRSALGLRPDRD